MVEPPAVPKEIEGTAHFSYDTPDCTPAENVKFAELLEARLSSVPGLRKLESGAADDGISLDVTVFSAGGKNAEQEIRAALQKTEQIIEQFEAEHPECRRKVR